MAIAAGTCPNCGHAEKRILKEGRARTIFTCPECQSGRIIARKIKMENSNGGGKEGNGNKETHEEGSNGEPKKEGKEEGKEEEASGNPPTKDEKTDGKPKGKVSSVRKVSYAKRESSGKTSSVSGKGAATGKRSSSGAGSGKASGNPSRKSPPTRAKREPVKREPKREPVTTSAAANGNSGDSEDWRGVYPYIY